MPFRTWFWITTRLIAISLCLGVALNGATGLYVPQLSAFDDFMTGLLEKWQIPGAALGVSHNGRLMLARGYGVAERRHSVSRESEELVQPDSLFRIAGISKTFTAAAILRLVEDGKLSLDEKVSSILTGFGAPADSRTNSVTVRELLQMTSRPGIDKTFDPSFLTGIVEKASGQTYEDYVRSAVLMPLGITGMQIAHRAVSIEAFDAAGGWIASVSDLLRFVNALDGRRPPMFLKQASLEEMIARPRAVSVGTASYTGLGWVIQPRGVDADWWNYGVSCGVSAYVFRQAATGVDAVILFNSQPVESDAFESDLSAGVVRTTNSILKWPAHDLFAQGPELFARDVVNAADYRGDGVAPGEIVVMFPSNVGPLQIVAWPGASTGVPRVFFDNIAAPIVYAVAGQVSAIVPREISKNTVTEVVIEYQGVRSPPVTIPVVKSLPALFTRDASGKGQAAMLNATGCCNSVQNPAMRGTTAYLFATGEGISLTPEKDRKAAPWPVTVTVGGVPAKVLYAGDAGVLEVNFRVPANAPVGGAVPVVLTVGNSHSSNGVTMAVRSAARRILVNDHEAAIRSRLIEILQGAGYEVLTALNGRQAGAQAKEYPVDLVITDLAMPEEAGLKMIRAIQSENPELKVIVISGEASPRVLRAADILGAQAVLRKPLTAKVVLRRVHDVLQDHLVRF